MKRFRNGVFLLACLSSPVLVATPRAGFAATMSDYCQVPPFVVSNVAPNVMLLISNSGSMRKFAYDNNHACTATDICGDAVPYNPAGGYYGYFDPGYWYSSGSSSFTPTVPKSSRGKLAGEWDGNFLNWLTMRRIDVLRKALTGGNASGGTFTSQIADSVNDGTFKEFQDPADYSPFTKNQDLLVEFSTGGASTAPTFTVTGPGINSTYKVNVDVLPGTTVEGVLQDVVGARARLGLTFFNADNQGGNVEPPLGFTSLSSVVNRINTPSNINGGASQPLAEALFTVGGYYAQVDSAAGLGIPAAPCLTGAFCPPLYHNGDYSTNVDAKDPFNYGSGGAVRYPPCARSFVLVISDGEPCGDGQIPAAIVTNTPVAYRYPGALANWCGLGGNLAGVESVALAAHVGDLRSATVGKNNIDRTQNLTLYVIQAFGSGSGILKRTAINGGFEDSDGSLTPNIQTEWDANLDNVVDNFYEATDGAKLEQALRSAFSGILRRASSGTAASVLASGEGSGANLVQAIFYPRRRFGNDVIMWTGSLQNLWYYVDPYMANASIHEDTVADKILNLSDDKLVRFAYDTTTDATNIQLYKTTATGTIDNTVAVVTRPFEQANSLWEAGKLLYLKPAANRLIFSIDNTATTPRTRRDFTEANLSYFRNDMDVPPVPPYTVDQLTSALISYVRGIDDPARVRPRTVVIGADNAVWKLGDIVHSTPRIAGGVPLNAYYKIYQDPTYKAFTDNANYRNRGMVFTGANDGMLHAFKLGKLEFSGAWKTLVQQKAKLSNFGDLSVALGSEIWAYVPRSALPYLKYLPDNNYCHLYYADLSPYIFDASIGAGSGDQSNDVRSQASWRTIVIGGMRTGGACRSSSGACNSTTGGIPDCVKAPGPGGLSSYFAIDITDPSDPAVLWEFSNEQLGFATTGPAVVRINGVDDDGNPDRNRNGHWYAVLASGPTGPVDNTYNQFLGRSDQQLRLFVLDLKTGALRRTIDTTVDGAVIPGAFAGSMINSSADFDLDYQDDAVFFGYAKKDTVTGTWTKGGIGRLATGGSANPATWAFSKVIDDIGPVTAAVVRLQNNIYHTNWLYFGEGRYYYERDTEVDDASGQRRLYGIKDPCFKSSNLYPTCTDAVTLASLTDQTTIDNTVSEAVANDVGFSGWYVNLANDNATLVNYGDGGHYYHAERVITDPLSVGSTGTVFFTSYRPYNEMCSLGGKSFIWAIRYNTGAAPNANALLGKALIQVSTASVEQLDLRSAFSGPQNAGGRRSAYIEGVPPPTQGLSILSPPPPVNRVLHMMER